MAVLSIPRTLDSVATNSTAQVVPNNWFQTLLSNAQGVADTFFSNAEKWRRFNDGDEGYQTVGSSAGYQTAPTSEVDKYLPWLAIGGLALVAMVVLRK